MKKFALIPVFLLIAAFSFAQVDEEETNEGYSDEGSTLEQPTQPVRPAVEFSWTQEDVGEFSTQVPYVHQRQSDVMYYITIWRRIDLREKVNHHLYFPQETRGTWRSLGQVILDAVDLDSEEENPNALPFYTDEYCNVPQSIEQTKAALVERRSIPKYDPETFELIGEEEITEQHAAKEISYYDIKELWFFDKERSTLEVRILQVAPKIEYEKILNTGPSEDGEEVGGVKQTRTLGHIYYDELRPYLAKQEVFNYKNNAQRLSLDDVLTWKREFSSYIYAEQNVYNDRWISDYILNARDQRLDSD
ncbi:MAG: gliding motility protein GldN, partial [Bacteroidales bacterium]|nr:gliding motility protein GldN [Bacteroidales bacterium]